MQAQGEYPKVDDESQRRESEPPEIPDENYSPNKRGSPCQH